MHIGWEYIFHSGKITSRACLVQVCSMRKHCGFYDVPDKHRALEKSADAILGGPSTHCESDVKLPVQTAQMKMPIGSPIKVKIWAHQLIFKGAPS